MFNGNTIIPVILLICGLFNFFYVLFRCFQKTEFEDFSDGFFCAVYMFLAGALTIIGTITIIVWEIYRYVKDAPRRNAERREKLCGLIQEFNVMTGKDKYER